MSTPAPAANDTTAPGAPKPKKSVALSGVTAGNTALCTVGRTGNDLHYRGYDILDVATREFAAKGLAGVYKEIDEELRSQYLLTYLPAVRKGDKWRKIEVKMTPDNLQARTISGYYP